ncbi:non-specific lipid transfer protein GPI-anchored 1 [Ricinus communis]|uniref:Lipid binding protein, putative n=1 Tax=Ricinus communis TaxID=3988 RepID=B9RMD9_RICCO|nr:non-specific lipid transfer protein GPI-anchored 1 [Ricinus communis]EEF47462.1 lipid binding protein, putative [Ricinus communis]|eukprot:XP_002514908.1 non-specific lipid transfer protein GPI-anchored 1 [Ricinus communis]
MGCQSLFVLSVFLILSLNCCSVSSDNIAEECSSEVQKVMPCLDYAKGKIDTPPKGCCSAVKDMKDSDPKCLCFIMQQTHNGSAEIKSLGIQEAKLLQLPSACQLQNASISFCPKLLGIPPNSPDAAIFTNATSTSTPAATATPGTSAPDTSNNDRPNGTMHRPYLAIATAIFIYIFTAGSAYRF